jgi:hypothetical protein
MARNSRPSDKMKRSRLRAATGMRYALLNPILDELIKESRTRMTVDKHGEWITLENYELPLAAASQLVSDRICVSI